MISYSSKGGSSIGVVSKVHYVMCGGVAECVEFSDACGRRKSMSKGKILGVLVRMRRAFDGIWKVEISLILNKIF